MQVFAWTVSQSLETKHSDTVNNQVTHPRAFKLITGVHTWMKVVYTSCEKSK